MPDATPEKTYRFELIARYYDESDPVGPEPRWGAEFNHQNLPYAAVVGMQAALLEALQTMHRWGVDKASGVDPQFLASSKK